MFSKDHLFVCLLVLVTFVEQVVFLAQEVYVFLF